MTIGIWKLSVTNVNGIKANISFYITRGDSSFLQENELLDRSYQLGPESLLRIPAFVRNISDHDLLLQTYFVPTLATDPETGRTYLIVVPSKLQSFESFLSARFALEKVAQINPKIFRIMIFQLHENLLQSCILTRISTHQI